VGDTQWPRYYVFEQPEEGEAFILAGSVHAPDPEMALLTARDTFARRPKRTAMWVVRDQSIFSRTREQLDAAPAAEAEPAGGTNRYQLFAKQSHKGVHVHIGENAAPDAETAIRRFDREHGAGRTPVWWAIEDGEIHRSEAADREILFESSPGKPFRHENEYPVRTMMMELKRKKV
jgi:ring-1,2-phenylacetyl-CoA epoxidase subunit PaaB